MTTCTLFENEQWEMSIAQTFEEINSNLNDEILEVVIKTLAK